MINLKILNMEKGVIIFIFKIKIKLTFWKKARFLRSTYICTYMNMMYNISAYHMNFVMRLVFLACDKLSLDLIYCEWITHPSKYAIIDFWTFPPDPPPFLYRIELRDVFGKKWTWNWTQFIISNFVLVFTKNIVSL